MVHEAYLRLVDAQNSKQWDNRAHYFVAAAEAMRRILIENARRKRSRKSGGGFTRVDLDEAHLTINPEQDDLLALHDSLSKLAQEDSPAAAVAKLRLLAGMTVDEAADSLGISRTTGFRHWTYARAFLQVELLLKAHAQSNALLDGNGVVATIDRDVTEQPGTQIGRYKLLEQVGEGGMGIVFVAEQAEPVRRRVTLKIIKPGMDSKQVIAQFEAERQALAMMDHPNIARVLDAGTIGEPGASASGPAPPVEFTTQNFAEHPIHRSRLPHFPTNT